MADNIRVNGNLLSWGSLGLKIEAERFYGFKSISYGEGIESVLVYGMGRHHAPRGRTRGKYVIEPLKLQGEVQTLKVVRQTLAARALDGKSYGTVEFEVFLEAVEQEQSSTTEFLRCRWAKNTGSFEESAEGLYEEIEISVLQIRRDGFTLFDASEGSP
jgi:hypothetical protein